MGQSQLLLLILAFILFGTLTASRFQVEATVQDMKVNTEVVSTFESMGRDAQSYWRSMDSLGVPKHTFVGVRNLFGSDTVQTLVGTFYFASHGPTSVIIYHKDQTHFCIITPTTMEITQ